MGNENMTKLTWEFMAILKTAELPAYEIAHRAGISPTTLSKLVNGIETVKPNDHRIIRVAEILGLTPDECFEVEPAEAG